LAIVGQAICPESVFISAVQICGATSVALFAQLGNEDTLRCEQRHQAIIERFGRYPHRNAILGRESTPEELAFLSEAESEF
jgi:uncharacterized protein (DUF924 family)